RKSRRVDRPPVPVRHRVRDDVPCQGRPGKWQPVAGPGSSRTPPTSQHDAVPEPRSFAAVSRSVERAPMRMLQGVSRRPGRPPEGRLRRVACRRLTLLRRVACRRLTRLRRVACRRRLRPPVAGGPCRVPRVQPSPVVARRRASPVTWPADECRARV
ncbi:MAG TPA: hypothetical protein VFV63_10680, partial [Ilumatobacteraceae bacterium]|nr:hypothetical protein [Ilumatobacteraceae bacterium]